MWPLRVYDPKRQNLEMFWTGKKNSYPRALLKLLPFELVHFRLNKELKKKTNGKFELRAQFILSSTVLEREKQLTSM